MRRFKFNLEKILQLRKFREEECKLALGQAVSFLNKIENDIKETAFKRHEAASLRFIDVAQTASWEFYIRRLDQLSDQLMEQAAQAQLVVEEKRAEYLEAQRDLKAIEKLKEKQQKEYRKEMFNYDMNEVDNLTSARFVRNSKLAVNGGE
jgi:flagellar FliJ protein